MKKRGKGVSPLIATVLLIGFSVIIAVAVWMWYGNVVQGQFMKQGAISAINQACLTDIELQVISASKGTDTIDIEIKNTGNKIFNGIRVLVNGGEDVLSDKESFKPSEQKIISVKPDPSKVSVSSATSIEVMPMIVRQGVPGTCSDKKIKYNLK